MLHLSYGSELVRGLDYQILLNRPLTLLAESASLHHTPAAGCLSGGDVLVSLSQRAKFFLAQCGNKSVHLSSCSTVLEPLRLIAKMPTTFGQSRSPSSTSLRSFPVGQVMFQFLIASLWQNCCFYVTSKVFQKGSTQRCSHV